MSGQAHDHMDNVKSILECLLECYRSNQVHKCPILNYLVVVQNASLRAAAHTLSKIWTDCSQSTGTTVQTPF